MSELELNDDDVLISNDKNTLSEYPFNKLNEILSAQEKLDLTNYVREVHKQSLTKEYWESLSEKEREQHIKCAKG